MKFRPPLSIYILSFLIALGYFTSCHNPDEPRQLFSILPETTTSIHFENRLEVNDSMNFFKYGYFYMGGGVAAGDLNGDGWTDLYFTANQGPDHLYLNQQNLSFREVTSISGIDVTNKWHTGCSLIDINNDGRLDIYVALAGIWNDRKNLLYVNQGNNADGIPQFAEMADSYGLADQGYSIQAAFFDYDQDGDLDLYVVNYPPTPFNTEVAEYIDLSEQVSWEESDHLYQNNGDGSFTDVTKAAGLLRFGLGIGIVTADFNQDNLTDIYVSNDFHTPDFFYLNQGDGSFREIIQDATQQTSFYGMGIDASDFNNDGLLDLIQMDMTSADNYRSKANMASMNIPAFHTMIQGGMHYQYMYNALQKNNGIKSDGTPFFSNIAKLNNLDMTDWSWACLFADYDHNGWRDLMVTNGTRRDINNKDYFKWLKRTDIKLKVEYQELSFKDLTDRLPSQPTDNYIFENTAGNFRSTNKEWGFNFTGFSNGATHADLDNDGDLEIIINNIDSLAVIFKNHAVELGGHFCQIQLKGPLENPLALGAKLWLYQNGQEYFHEHTLVRGYQSSVDTKIHFGLPQGAIDSIRIRWPNGKISLLENPPIDELITISYESAQDIVEEGTTATPLQLLSLMEDDAFQFSHKENAFDDYAREILLPHKMSSFGPGLAVSDLNQDGHDDLFISGAAGQHSRVFVSKQQSDHSTIYTSYELSHPEQEDVDGIFIDVNQDGQLDLLIQCGGNEEENLGSSYYQQRLYLNSKGHLQESTLPNNLRLSAANVCASDYNNDGSKELFLMGRQIPGQYPSPASSFLLQVNANDNSSGFFKDITKASCPKFENLGMVTDACWTDFDNDGDKDLIVIGEWMGITFFENKAGKLHELEIPGISDQVGWWYNIANSDFDNDGDEDYLITNLGTNYKYQAKNDETFDIYAHDFDANNKLDIVLGYYQEGIQYPVRGRQCSSEQIPKLAQKFSTYHSFASATLEDVYSSEQLQEGIHYQANRFEHVYLENLGGGQLTLSPLPPEFQQSTYTTSLVIDINLDGFDDLIMAGNIFDSEVETPRSDAEYGTVALGDGKGNFNKLPFEKTGLYLPYETQDIDLVKRGQDQYLVFANNNAPLLVYKINHLISHRKN